jgi:hypothetical protein
LEHIVNMDWAKACKSNFIQPDFTILIQLWLSVNHFKVLPLKDNIACSIVLISRHVIRELASYSRSSVIIYSDASSVAAGDHTVELDSKVFHTNWSENEKSNSSTWREMRTIEQAMLSFKGKTLKWFTDNHNCIRIIITDERLYDANSLIFIAWTLFSQNNNSPLIWQSSASFKPLSHDNLCENDLNLLHDNRKYKSYQ